MMLDLLSYTIVWETSFTEFRRCHLPAFLDSVGSLQPEVKKHGIEINAGADWAWRGTEKGQTC